VSDYLGTDEAVDADKTKEFFETYWFPYFNSPMVLTNPYSGNSIYDINGNRVGISIYTDYALGRVLFSTQDGTVYNVWVMSWKRDEEGNNLNIPLYNTYQQVIIDINGQKGPNRYGKDIFIFAINFNNNVVKANCQGKDMVYINNNCNINGSGACCAAKIIKDGWQIKDDYPW